VIIDRWTFEWVQITSPRVVRELYTRKGDDVDHEATKAWVRPMMGSNAAFVLSGPDHVKVRQAVVPELTEKQVEQYREMSIQVLDRMIDELPLNSRLTLHHFFAAFAQEVILRATFGDIDQAEIDELRRWLNRSIEYAFANRLRLLTGLFIWPALRPWSRRGDSIPRLPFRSAHKIRRQADRILYRKIAELRAEPNDSIASRLIARSGDDEFWTDKVLRDTLATLLLAGHDTSVSAYSWAVEYLLRDSGALSTLRAEARAGETDRYAQACAMEALRLKPPVWGPMSLARRDMELAGYRIRKGSFMFASGLSVHADSTVYPDPLSFRPDRFLDRTPDQYSFLSFSTGRHRCPGRNFFATEAGLLLHRVFGRLDIEPCEPRIDRTFMDHGFFNRPKAKVPVMIRRRREATQVPPFRPADTAAAPAVSDADDDLGPVAPSPRCPFAGSTTG
jgi:cytochrome P450